MKTHTPGPGLKVLSTKKWYGGGWRVGVLCSYCGEDAASRGPRRGDYAFRGQEDQADRIGILASFGDEDATYTDTQDRLGL